jgi:hypothetical protein
VTAEGICTGVSRFESKASALSFCSKTLGMSNELFAGEKLEHPLNIDVQSKLRKNFDFIKS